MQKAQLFTHQGDREGLCLGIGFQLPAFSCQSPKHFAVCKQFYGDLFFFFFFLKSILIRATDETSSGGCWLAIDSEGQSYRGLPNTLPPLQLHYWIFFFNQRRVSPPSTFSSHTPMPACWVSDKGKCVKPGLLIHRSWRCLCPPSDRIPPLPDKAADGPFSSRAHDVFHLPRSGPW